ARVGKDRAMAEGPRAGLGGPLIQTYDAVVRNDERRKVGDRVELDLRVDVAEPHVADLGRPGDCAQDLGARRGAAAIERVLQDLARLRARTEREAVRGADRHARIAGAR